MAACLSLLIVILVLGTLRKSGHERKGDFGFVVMILVLALLIWSSQS